MSGASGGRRRPAPPLVEWARAILHGIEDTAREMVSEGRRGAREAEEAGWRRYEAKTKHRRGARR